MRCLSGRWRSSTDLNYSTRCVGRLDEAEHVFYLEGNNYAYAHFIASLLLSSVVPTTQIGMRRLSETGTRMKKIVRDGYEVAMKTLPHDSHPTGEKPLRRH